MAEKLVVIARLTAKEGQADALGETLKALIAPTRAEAGALDYVLHRDAEDPRTWIFYESWRSRSDLDAHFEQPYMKALLARAPELLEGDVAMTFCTVVEP